MSLLDDVSIAVTPNGYKAGTLYAVKPTFALGSELVTNGDFATADLSSFSVTYATQEIVSEELKTTLNTAHGYGFTRVTFTAEIGKRYRILVSAKQGTSTGTLVKPQAGLALINSGSTTGDWSFDGIGVATSTTCQFRLQVTGASGVYGLFDNVSVKEYTASDMDVTRATAATRVDENGLVNYAEVIGSELVSCGDFACADPDAVWSRGTGWTISGNLANFTYSTPSSLTQDLNVTSGLRYLIEYEIVSNSGVSLKGGGNSFFNVGSSIPSTVGLHSFYVTAVNSSGIDFRYLSGSGSLSVTNVSVKEVTRDNVPRIDYTGGGCPHILAEPQRTNTVTYSEDFSQYNQSGTTPTLTTGQLAPDGTLGATKISGTIGSSVMWLPDDSSATATRSIYARTVSGTGTATLMSYNLNTNNLFTLTEEWQRFELTGTTTGAGGTHFYIDFRDSSQTLSEFIVWGGQSEEATYATSYIPTSGSTVTRNQDTFTRDGIGSLINSTEGVLFAEMAALSDDLTYKRISLSDSTEDNRISISYDDVSNTISGQVFVGGVEQSLLTYVLSDITEFSKIALKYRVNDFELWVDGYEVATGVSGSVFPQGTLNSLSFDKGSSLQNFFGKVKQLQVYDTTLTVSQLENLTV